jgi:NAD(P)H dehydrogenase (quinone)
MSSAPEAGIRVLVVFHSRAGNTLQLAKALADGARSFPGATVDLKRVPEIRDEQELLAHEQIGKTFMEIQPYPRATAADVVNYDVVVLGAPVRLGAMSGEMKHFIDTLGPLWQRGALRDKVGAVFTSASTIHGGHEVAMLGCLATMMHLGMIIVAPGYVDPIFEIAGSPYGATASTKPAGVRTRPDGDALQAAAALGLRAATVGSWVVKGRGHS